MLPTFVIGLREGLEAALIVGIVAAFLRQNGRTDLLRWAFLGVAAAILLCVSIGIALDLVSKDLPQKQQEGLETVIGACAVAMVTYMVIWMRRHSRTLKGQLEGAAGAALAAGSGFALVVMAFLAVLREGLETVVFLLAAFNQSSNPQLAGIGALLGIIVAIALGWGIYRGGVVLNLSKFFRFTGIVLTLVAAGLVVSALHTAHEAGWLDVGQQQTVDLTALVRPGSVQASLLTGMLGVQPKPVLIEVIGWLVYLVPVGLYIAWPQGRGLSAATRNRLLFPAIGVGVVAAVVLALLAPGAPGRNPAVRLPDGTSAQIVSLSGGGGVVEAAVRQPALSATPGASRTLPVTRRATEQHHGVHTVVYATTLTGPADGAPATMTYDELAQRNGGRLPLGARPANASGQEAVQVTEESVDVGTFWVEPHTGRIVDVAWDQTISLTAKFDTGATAIGTAGQAAWALPAAPAAAAASAARSDVSDLHSRSTLWSLAVVFGVLAVLLLAFLIVARLRGRTRPGGVLPVTQASELVGS